MSMRENDNSTSAARSGFADGGGSGGTVVAPTFIQPNPVPGYAGYGYSAPMATMPGVVPTTGYGSGGLIESLVLLSALGGRGLGVNDCNKNAFVDQACADIRKDVADNGKEIHVLGNEMQAAFSRLSLQEQNEFRSLFERICAVEEKAMDVAHRAEVGALRSTGEIINAITSGNANTKDILFGLSTNMNTQFCNTNHLIERNHADILLNQERNTNQITLQAERNTNSILTAIKDGFCDNKVAHLQETIDELRDERGCNRRKDDISFIGNLLSAQTTGLLQAVNSQLQKQTSDIIQFGTGNVALPTNTNTQVG